jgi:hypothetical protein
MNENINSSIAERLEGQWLCDEISTLNISNIDQYRVYSKIDPNDSNQILIENFYQLSNDTKVIVTTNETTITQPRQSSTDSFNVNGAETFSSKYDKITWRYYVDDGRGFEYQVDAVYMKVY